MSPFFLIYEFYLFAILKLKFFLESIADLTGYMGREMCRSRNKGSAFRPSTIGCLRWHQPYARILLQLLPAGTYSTNFHQWTLSLSTSYSYSHALNRKIPNSM
ncbi:unnamed protein product [Citrullus colocynthis]|uniref:Uncharacterized protein n=1 Tax=Citrullus colocynthis TaxID=252529 RepID=A0ABP0XML9_9ROSI